jgi:hypothetical protein
MTISLSIFIGIKITKPFEEELKHSKKAALFTAGGNYLTQLKIESETYLGKKFSQKVDLNELEAHQKHVESLLRLINPKYNQAQDPLLVLSVDS